MFKKNIVLLLTMMMLIVLASCEKKNDDEGEGAVSEWDGSLEVTDADKPKDDGAGNISIESAKQLVWFAHSVNGTLDENGNYDPNLEGDGDEKWNARMNNANKKDYSGKVVTLKVDINLNKKDWPVIGRGRVQEGIYNTETTANKEDSTPFKGTFDGDGKVIRNLKINENSSYKGKAIGLFGRAESGALIKNLKIVGTFSIVGEGQVAAILGEGIGEDPGNTNPNPHNTVRLANVAIDGTGTIKSKGNGWRTSGIVAHISYGEVVFAYNNGVKIDCEASRYTAGIVGCVHGGIVKYAYNSATVNNSINNRGTAGVTAHTKVGYTESGNSITPDSVFTGGSKQDTFNVFNKGTITDTTIDTAQPRFYAVGGVIADHSKGKIEGSFNTGNVYGPSNNELKGQIIGRTGKSHGDEGTPPSLGVNYYLEPPPESGAVRAAYGLITEHVTEKPPAESFTTDTSLVDKLNESANAVEGAFKPKGGNIWKQRGNSKTDVIFNEDVVRRMTDELYKPAGR